MRCKNWGVKIIDPMCVCCLVTSVLTLWSHTQNGSKFNTIQYCCTLWRFHGVLYTRGGKFPLDGVQNPWTSVTACTNCFVIHLYNCYSSSGSSVVIFKHYYDGLFINKTNCCTLWLGSICFVHPRGQMAPPASPIGYHFPPHVYKTSWTPSQRAIV